MRKLAFTLVPLLFLACGREAVAPDAGPAPSFAATSDWTRSSVFFDVPDIPVPCRGTLFRFHGEVPYMQHEVTSASGVQTWHFVLLPQKPVTPPYYGEEQGTGIVFLYKNGGPLNESFHLAAGEVYSQTAREVYNAPNGDQINTRYTQHYTVNATGELVVDRSVAAEWQCVFR